jgi:hypothetical protein
MKATLGRLGGAMVAAAVTLMSVQSQAQTVLGLWNFDTGLNATVGDELSYSDSATQSGTQFSSTTTLGISDIGGTTAKVMRFPANKDWAGYYLTTPSIANGGNGAGTLFNDFTLIFDVYYPAGSNAKYRPLVQTDSGSMTGTPTTIAVFANNGVGATSGTAQGTVTAEKWTRIALVFDSESGTLKKYLDGVSVGSESIGSYDGSFALVPGTASLVLGSTGTEAAPGYINSMALWSDALGAGHIRALGAAVATGIPQTLPPSPSYIDTQSPVAGETGVSPLPAISVTLMAGDTTISANSISLQLDGAALTANVVSVAGGYTLTATPASVLPSGTPHTLNLIYTDSSVGKQTNSWSFTVKSYQNITLPAPVYLETFDNTDEGSLPDGWSVTNNTTAITSGMDLDDPTSDAYMNFVVVSADRLRNVFTSGNNARFQMPAIVLNGAILDSLMSGNLFYADSDYRDGNQVQVAFTKDYNLTGKTNIFVAWKSIYEQNQDNMASVEYSVDKGATWLPVIYYLDDQNGAADVIRTNGVIDVTATFGTPRADQAYGLSFGSFIGAKVGTNLIPYIAGRINDSVVDGKRIEFVRIPMADNQSTVRFRFCQAGTGSWYFGIDDFGIYSVNNPVIATQPASQSANANTAVTFSVDATSSTPMTYQWQYNGTAIPGATNATYTLATATPATAGNYTVVVSNTGGSVTSATAVLTVVSVPVIITNPQPQLLSAGTTINLSATAQGGMPLTYYWLFGSTLINGANTTNLIIPNATTAASGYYAMIASNSYGMATSATARVTVFDGAINSDLVAHLKFDGNYTDSTSHGVNGQAVNNPTFETGFLGQAVHLTSSGDNTVNNYVTLGYPDALKFGTSDFSISFWAKINSQADDEAFISNKDWDSGSNPGWVIASESDGMKWNVNDTAKANRHESGHVAPKIENGSWHLITVTFERAGYGKTYVDGALVDTTSMAPNSGVAISSLDTDELGLSVNLGQDGTGAYTDNGANTPAIDMLMDDLGIWKRVLTPEEIASIYVQGLAGKDLTTASGHEVVLPPTITASPVSQAISAGATASLSVTATGPGTLSYAWFNNGTPVSGTSSELTFTATTADAGAYYAVVSNAGGSVTSSVAQLIVFSGAITNDLVLHMKFDGDYSDSSGRGNNATAVGAPEFVPGKLGQAMKFTSLKDGSSFNYATLGRPSDLQFADNDFSVSFWANYTTSSDDPPFITDKDWNLSNNQGWGVFTQNGGNFKVNVVGTNGGTDKYNTAYNTVVRDGTWHLITVTFWRGTQLTAYVDGAQINTSAFPTAGSLDSGLNVNIGQDGTGTYTDGGVAEIKDALIDDLGIWRRILTQNEVNAIYTAGMAGQDLTLPNQGTTLKLSYTIENATKIKLTWTANASVRLQKATKLGPAADWTDVSGTAGAGSYEATTTDAAAFYRLIK